MVMMDKPSPIQVGREFVRQYYTLLNKAPDLLHRFYSANSSYLHGGKYCNGEPEQPIIGQSEIHHKIESLNFCDCHTKIKQVDAHTTIGSGVVVQVTGELSNAGRPLRRFMQTFVLAPQGENPYKFYVHNDIFRYQDDVFNDEAQGEHSDDEEQEIEEETVATQPDQPPPVMASHYQDSSDYQRPVSERNVEVAVTNGMEQGLDSLDLNQTDLERLPSNEEPIASDAPSDSKPDVMEEEKADLSDPVPESTLAPSNESEIIEPTAPAPSKPLSWADRLTMGTSSSRSAAPPTLAAKPARSAPPEQTDSMDHVEQSARTQRGFRGNQRPRDDDRGGFGDRTERRGIGSNRDAGPIRYPDNQQIFVGNLPYEIEEADLREHFEDFGQVIEVKINHSTTSNPSFGFVIFKDTKSVDHVLSRMPTQFKNNYRINIEEKKQKSGRDNNRRGGDMRRGGGMGDNRGGRRAPPGMRRDRQGSRERSRGGFSNVSRR